MGPRHVSGSQGEDGATLAARLHDLASRVEAFGFSGQVLVRSGGEILLHRAYGVADAAERRPMTTATGLGVASMSKQFAGAAVLWLVERGRLSLEDSLSAWLPDVPADKRGITVRQLLAHRSGVRSRYRQDFEPSSRELMIRGILDTPLAFAPGTGWEYSFAGYNLIAAIVERATGTSYGDFLRTALFRSAGMRHTHLLDDVPDGADVSRSYLGWSDRGSPAEWPTNLRNFGAGDVISTAGDLERWDRSVREGRIFLPATVETYLGPLGAVDEGTEYGFGLFLYRDGAGRAIIEHGGDAALGFNGSFHRYSDDDFLVIVTSNSRTPSGQWMRHALGEGIETILRGGEPELPPPAVSPTAEDVRRLVGTYETADGGVFHILTDGAHLWLAGEGQPAISRLAGLDHEENDAATLANAKTEELLGGLLAADSTAFLTALTGEGAPHFPDYWSDWRKLTETRGVLHRFRILGSTLGAGPAITRATLEFRTGQITMAFFWGELGAGRIRGTSIDSVPYRPPVALALARSPTGGLVAHDLFGTVTLPVEVTGNGDLRIGNGSAATMARAVGSAGWVPTRLVIPGVP